MTEKVLNIKGKFGLAVLLPLVALIAISPSQWVGRRVNVRPNACASFDQVGSVADLREVALARR